jgi:superfamily II DNA/RNA helicase
MKETIKSEQTRASNAYHKAEDDKRKALESTVNNKDPSLLKAEPKKEDKDAEEEKKDDDKKEDKPEEEKKEEKKDDAPKEEEKKEEKKDDGKKAAAFAKRSMMQPVYRQAPQNSRPVQRAPERNQRSQPRARTLLQIDESVDNSLRYDEINHLWRAKYADNLVNSLY